MSYKIYEQSLTRMMMWKLRRAFQDSTDDRFSDWVRTNCNCRFKCGGPLNNHYFIFNSQEEYFLFLLEFS